MAEHVVIGLSEPARDLQARLDQALGPLAARGARLQFREIRRGPLVFLDCACDGPTPRSGTAFRQAVATAVCGLIIEVREPELLRLRVASHYGYFQPGERAAICARAREQLGPDPARRGPLAADLLAYLERASTLVIDGFVTFRLPDYRQALAIAVDQAVDDFLLEREYREFVGLLRHVVESRPQRPEVTHCLLGPAGAFELRDDAGRPVGTDFLADAAPPATARDVGSEDLLVSALITIAPRTVRVHLGDPAANLSEEAMGTLREVFAKSVSTCHGCPRCQAGGGEGEASSQEAGAGR